MHSLDSPRLKITRAKDEINRLGLMQDAFLANTHYSVVRAEKNLVSGKDVLRIKIDGSPPSLEWGVYIGEIAHNLCSALNHLVYQLALLNSSNKPETVAGDKRLQFPIFLTEPEFKAKWGESMIKLLKPEHKASIKRLQPYNSSGSSLLKTIDLTKWSGCNSPLFWLKEINNADKHRIIQVVGIRPSSFGAIYWGERTNPFTYGGFSILEDGAKFGEADSDVQVDTQLHPLIAFADGCEAVINRPVCLLLDLVATTVSEIVDSFASEFK
ncbi:MAG TPA: hypothetical protein VGA85_02950 [Dehalococcoidales bacterium]